MSNSENPWYKQFWAWFLIVMLAFGVVIGLSLLTVAIRYGDSLVVDNYYEAGQGINTQLDREILSKTLKIKARIQLYQDRNTVTVDLLGQSTPAQLQLNFISPTQVEKDRHIILQRQENGQYQGVMPETISGRRFVELIGTQNGHDWRLFEEHILQSNQPILLGY